MTPGPELVDLQALRRAAGPVVAWYEQFLAGAPMPLAELDRALLDLQGLPPVGGRLGRALAILATAGRDATTEEAVAAFELLRHTAGLRHAARRTEPPPAAQPKRRRRRASGQLPLPGIDEP